MLKLWIEKWENGQYQMSHQNITNSEAAKIIGIPAPILYNKVIEIKGDNFINVKGWRIYKV